MNPTDTPTNSPPRLIRKAPAPPIAPKRVSKPWSKPASKESGKQSKPPDFTIKPYPDDVTKGKLDLQGTFRFDKASDLFDWAYSVWRDPSNKMEAYIYRQRPVCNFDLSTLEDAPELGHYISKWESWPFGDSDYHIGMLEMFGSGTYLILFKDAIANRRIAKIEDWELMNYGAYPPKIRIDDVVLESSKNKSFIAWARNAGCKFSIDQGYEPGKFVHIETQRHKGANEEDMSNPTNQVISEFVTETLRENLQSRKTTPPIVAVPSQPSLDHQAAVTAIEIVKDTANYAIQKQDREQGTVLKLIEFITSNTQGPRNDSSLEAMKMVIENIKETSKSQLEAVQRDRELLLSRLERLESRRHEIAQSQSQGAERPDQGEAAMAYIEKMEALMTRLGYSRRGGPIHQEEPPARDLMGVLVEATPSLINNAMQAFTTYMNVQLEVARLQARGGVGVAAPGVQGQPQTGVLDAQVINNQPPPINAQPINSTQGAVRPTANEAMRSTIGPDFDFYVSNFHDAIDKMAPVIKRKFVDGMQMLITDQVEDATEQYNIMADHGAELANWYLELPDNAHAILVGYQEHLLKVLMSYKPIWDGMGKAPIEMQLAFIAGFCTPERLDQEAYQPPAPVDIN